MNRSLRWLSVLVLTTAAAAQDDLRDRIVLNNGRTVEGRVSNPFAKDELVVVQGGKRQRVDVAEIAERKLVATAIREFFERRQKHADSPRAMRFLVDWAKSKQLDNLARLLALELVLQGDSDDELRELLGHRRRGKQWRWPHGSKFMTEKQLAERMLKRPLRLVGERFALSCDAGILTNVRALFDLERLGVEWFEQFGEDLQLEEVLQPIEIRTFRNMTVFPKWGFRPRPYFEPAPHGDIGRTFYAGPTPKRPDDLFFLGTHGLLYHTMIGEVDRRNPRDRACAWLEIGLSMYMQQRMHGPAGFAVPGAARQLDLQAIGALGRGYRLTHIVHLPMYGSFYLTDDNQTAVNWKAVTMFTTWLLDGDKQTRRQPFLAYIRAALAERKGDSSSLFDKVIGEPIEALEQPWRVWLNEIAGN